jgi:predicted metal-binding protein
MEELLTCHKKEEVLGYCQYCDNYNKNYSCPDFDFSVDDYLGQYDYATLVMTTVNRSDFDLYLEGMREKEYNSKTRRRYETLNKNHNYTWEETLSLYIFDEVKERVYKRLLTLEEKVNDAVSLPPGSCTKCDTCNKEMGQGCCDTKGLRYSLEAMGFLVSDIYMKYFNRQLEWVDAGLPTTFDTCSALLSNKVIEEKLISNYLKEIPLYL